MPEAQPQDDDAEKGMPAHITFDPAQDVPRGRSDAADNPSGDAVSRRSSRSMSRHRANRARNTMDLPIGYRTLSIQVSESQNVADVEAAKKAAAKVDDTEYFASLDLHTLSTAQICQRFNVVADQGLSESGAAARRARLGPNMLPQPKTNYLKKILGYIFGGFCSVLWVGSIMFFICWKPLSDPPSKQNLSLAVLILIVIFLQSSFNAFQDWSTQKTMKSITDLLPTDTLLLRDGERKKLPASELVDGDIVLMQSGNKVPADVRILSCSDDVRFDRGILTGESDEIEGVADCTDPNFLESRNIALMGTTVVNGNAVGVVILTGTRSVMGRIAQATSGVKEKPTLIQLEIWRFVRIIVVLTVILALVILIAWAAWLRVDYPGYMSVAAMLNNVMGCVVAFIPEGMPVAVTLTLMMVARRMKAANVLPKSLSVVETLGSVNVLCSDKTGTLTQNLMTARSVAFVDDDEGPASADDFHRTLESDSVPPHVTALHRASILCNEAYFEPTTIHLPVRERTIEGNATDVAVFRLGAFGRGSDNIRSGNTPVYSIPFNSKNKYMTTVLRNTTPTTGGDYTMLVKGAPDVLLPGCTHYWSSRQGTVQPLDDQARQSFRKKQDGLSERAERVVVLCERSLDIKAQEKTNSFGDEVASQTLQGLTVIGMVGIIDPPRPEAAHTVSRCRQAGIRFFMVTGDYGLTAAAIARSIGILSSSAPPDTIDTILEETSGTAAEDLRKDRLAGNGRGLVLEGSSLGSLAQGDWDVVCEYAEVVFARTTPEQKLRIVNELRQRGNTVAVTGDGVNDAPALRAADVGVAMVTGSDVAMDAADLVLMGGFDSIVEAVRLGRLVLQNLQRVIAYLLPAGSCSEIWPVLLNVFFGVPLPLNVFLMIVICVFTDLLLSLSLIMEKEEEDLLALPPRDPRRDHLVTRKMYGQSYLFMGSLETVAAHAMFFLYMWSHAGISVRDLFFLFSGYKEGFHGYTLEELTAFNVTGQSVYFVCLVVLQWGNILAVRNRRLSILQSDPVRKPRRNPWLLLSLLLSLVIAVFVTEVPGIQSLFGTASVPIRYWLIPLPLAFGMLIMDEARKLLVRTFPKGFVARAAW